MNDDAWDLLHRALDTPAMEKALRAARARSAAASRQPRKPRRRPTVHQGCREGAVFVPLCGSKKTPLYLTDHAFKLAPNGPVTCNDCRGLIGLPLLKAEW